jgi:hypothetical protein
MAFEREWDAGLDREYLDEDHYVLTGPHTAVDSVAVARGPFTWRYDGQQVFNDAAGATTGLVPLVAPPFVLTGTEFDPEGYFGVGYAVRVDRMGRRWVLDAIDLPAIEAEIADYAARFATEGEATAADFAEGEPGISFPESSTDGVVEWVDLTSWTFEDCDDLRNFWHHDGNGHMEQSPPLDALAPERATVWILTANGVDCTGTLVAGDDAGEMAILTAAHCVTEPNGAELNPNAFTVCTLENLVRNHQPPSTARCFGIEEVIKNPFWTGSNPYDITADYALLLFDDLDPRVEPMEMSPFSDAYIEGFADHHVGYPVYEPGLPECVLNEETALAELADPDFDGRYLYQASGDVQATPTGYVKYDVSTCKGCSGAPHYFCPTGDCDEEALVTGIQTAKFMGTGNRWVGGPKVLDVRGWAIPHIPYPGPESCDDLVTDCNCPRWEDTLRCTFDGQEWNPANGAVRVAQSNLPPPQVVDGDGPFSLKVIPDYAARCADGTFPAIYIDMAVDAQGNDMPSDKWIIAIPGGGACSPHDDIDLLGAGLLDLGPLAELDSSNPPKWVLSPFGDSFDPYCGPCYLRSFESDPLFKDDCDGLTRADFTTNDLAELSEHFGLLSPAQANPFAGYNRIWFDKCGADSYRGRARWEENWGALVFQTTSAPNTYEPGGAGTLTDFFQEGNLQWSVVLNALRPGLAFTDYSVDPPVGKVLPPLEDLEQLLIVGYSGGAGGLPYYIDDLTQQVNAWSDGGPPKDVRVVLSAFHLPSIENEVGCKFGIDNDGILPDLACRTTPFDAYDHVWNGISYADSENIAYDPDTADAAFVFADQQVRADTWNANTDLSCLISHPADPTANPEQRECRSNMHLVLNHVSTPMFIHQDLADPTISTLISTNEDFYVPWAVCTDPNCGDAEFDNPGEWKARLDLQATTLFDWFDHWSELATGDDPTFNLPADPNPDTPTIYGFFPDCAAAPTHEAVYSSSYYNNVTVDGESFGSWLWEFAQPATPPMNEQQLLITRDYLLPPQGPPTVCQ